MRDRTSTCNIFHERQLVPSSRDWIFLAWRSARSPQHYFFWISNSAALGKALRFEWVPELGAGAGERKHLFSWVTDFHPGRQSSPLQWFISYTLSDPQLLQQGLGQDETKNWKLLRGMKNTQPIPLSFVGLNLSFLCWKVFRLCKLSCCPHIKKH